MTAATALGGLTPAVLCRCFRRLPLQVTTLGTSEPNLHLLSIEIVDDDSAKLQRSIFTSKIRRARAMPAAQKMADATVLFDDTLVLMRAAIATEHPTFGPDQVEAEVARRLQIARRLDEAGIYQPAGTIDDEP